MSKPSTWPDSAIDRLDVPILVVGPDRTVKYANRAAQRLFGTSENGLDGVPMERLIVPEQRAMLRNLDDVLAGGGARRVRSALRRGDGVRVDVTMTLEPCVDAAGYVGAVSVRYEGLRGALSSGRPSLPPAEWGRFASDAPAGASLPPPLPGRGPASSPGVGDASTGRAPMRSERRLAPAKGSDLEQRLARLEKNLQWLEERLSVPSGVASLDDPRERGRAMLVVAESRSLVFESLEEFERARRDESIPAAPKVPKL